MKRAAAVLAVLAAVSTAGPGRADEEELELVSPGNETFTIGGYAELQLRALSDNFDVHDWYLSQWAFILNVEPGSTAARAGLSEGDVIVRVGRENVSNAVDASRELGRVPSGGTAFLRVLRNGQETFVSVAKE